MNFNIIKTYFNRRKKHSDIETVVQVVQHMRPGGIETMALDLANFCEQNSRTFIISLEGDIESAINHWPRLKPFTNRLLFLDKRPGVKPLLIYRLSRLLKKLRADVVHTHHIGPLIYAGLAARLAGVKCLIHTEHDAWHLDNPQRCELQRWSILLIQPQLVADANSVALSMKLKLHISNDIKVIHNGIDTERFIPGDIKIARRQLGLPQEVQLIGCSGRLEKVKGQKILIYALAQLPTTVHLALAGAGSTEADLHRLVETLKLDRRVHFLGRIDEMPTFYQALDIFCLPSFSEGLPLSPLEAQACGIPTAVTNVGGTSEALCPASGVLIPVGDVDAMSSTINRILNHPEKTSPRHFVQNYRDVRMMVQGYAELRHI